MSSSSSGSNFSWTYAAASVAAGVGAGYVLGVASTRWLASGESAPRRRESRPSDASLQQQQQLQQPPALGLGSAAAGSLVAAVVELTAEVCENMQNPGTKQLLLYVKTYTLISYQWLTDLSALVQVARLRQSIEAGGLLTRLNSRRSVRGGSTADFVSARGDNTESDDDFFDPK